jgi:hypothetical protein
VRCNWGKRREKMEEGERVRGVGVTHLVGNYSPLFTAKWKAIAF